MKSDLILWLYYKHGTMLSVIAEAPAVTVNLQAVLDDRIPGVRCSPPLLQPSQQLSAQLRAPPGEVLAVPHGI